MSLLKRAENMQAYLKCGILGFAGAGKTFTATSIALGLCELTGNETVAMFDTETGSDFMLDRFDAAGIRFYVHKGRAFTDLMEYIRECQQDGIGTLIIDSITHVWRDITQSYCRKLGRKRLQFQDWAALKDEWCRLTDAFVNSRLHIIMCGRAGYEYDWEEDEEGNRELIKTGVKMKVESELGFEPSLLIEMERVRTKNLSKEWVRRATVLKDRTDQLDGLIFDDPVFGDFMPHISRLRLGGEHLGVDTSRTSEALFEKPDYTYAGLKRRQAIAIEKIHETFLLHGLDGTAKETQQKRAKLLIEIFDTSSKTAIEGLSAEVLEAGLEKLRGILDPPAAAAEGSVKPTLPLPAVTPEELAQIIETGKSNAWPEAFIRLWIERNAPHNTDIVIAALDKFGKVSPNAIPVGEAAV